MHKLVKGHLEARIATCAQDIEQAQQLRRVAFADNRGVAPCDLDDDIDAAARHVLIFDHRTGDAVAAFRLLSLSSGQSIRDSYSARYYDLQGLGDYQGPMLEVGRFCTHPDYRADSDIIRLAWAMITAIVDAEGVAMLFGCSSFEGTMAETYLDTFELLRTRHLAPGKWLPRIKAPQVFPFGRLRRQGRGDARAGLSRMPPLLRSYLAMGGWVSDHAVVDRNLNTLHVFTGLEIGAIPAARKQRLRALLAG